MISGRKRRGAICVASAGLAACLMLQPFDVYAAESTQVKNILQQAGIASLLEIDLTQEEYVAKAQEAQGASWGYTNIGIANVESGNLNVRAEASKSGKVVGKMPKNAACEILELDKENGWAHIKSGEVEGYVSAEFLLTGPDAKLRANELVRTVVIADTDGLRVRDEANVESFGKYVQKMQEKTQFIIITHKKKTMEFVDVLYGITMQESGVSKLVSVKLEDN